MRCEWKVQGKEHGEKLLHFLRSKKECTPYSQKKIKSFIDSGFCTVNGKKERFSTVSLETQDLVSLLIPEITKAPLFFSEDAILFEDENIFIYNKPCGLVSDPKAVASFFPKQYSLHLTHRLDKDTTGVLLFAKNVKIRDALMDGFRNRLIKKRYLAIVDGLLKEERGVMENYL